MVKVSGQWSVVSGQWSDVSCLLFVVRGLPSWLGGVDAASADGVVVLKNQKRVLATDGHEWTLIEQ